MHGVALFDKYADEYDRWFDANERIYQAEVNALRKLVPRSGFGVEIGVGTGRFSVPFGIRIGIDPARSMAQIAKARDISVCQALGECLPFSDCQFDFALLVTVICFVSNVTALLREARRVLKPGGQVVVGFIDRNSALGQLYESRKDTDKFYREAHFHIVREIADRVAEAGFDARSFSQTLFGIPGDKASAYQVRDGYGEGAFVVLSAVESNTEMD